MTYTPEQLQVILARHAAWLHNEAVGLRADLSGADLSGADLRGADLRGADLYRVNLSWANLRGTALIVLQAVNYTAYIVGDVVRIGCQCQSAADWLATDDETINAWGGDPAEWALFRPLIEVAVATSLELWAQREAASAPQETT